MTNKRQKKNGKLHSHVDANQAELEARMDLVAVQFKKPILNPTYYEKYGLKWLAAEMGARLLHGDECIDCMFEGRAVEAEVLHHIAYGSHFFDPHCLVPLCTKHHKARHGYEHCAIGDHYVQKVLMHNIHRAACQECYDRYIKPFKPENHDLD
jgi:hypothetical protein